VRAFTRAGHDWSDRYRPIVKACRALKCRSATIDGEVVVEDERGVSDSDALHQSIQHHPERLAFFAFDLLSLDGRDLRARPLAKRRDMLQAILKRGHEVRFSESFQGDGAAFFAAACKQGREGFVLERKASAYRSGRSSPWLKVKNITESEFVVVGLERDYEGRWYALVGSEEARGLACAGMAFVNFAGKDRDTLSRKIAELAIDTCSLPGVKRPQADVLQWVRPELRGRVRHLNTSAGLRHASVRGIASTP
jgi:ATP-dependent DNA ligase